MLVPVRYSIKEKIGVYVEPNVWKIYELKECWDLRSTMIAANVRYSLQYSRVIPRLYYTYNNMVVVYTSHYFFGLKQW